MIRDQSDSPTTQQIEASFGKHVDAQEKGPTGCALSWRNGLRDLTTGQRSRARGGEEGAARDHVEGLFHSKQNLRHLGNRNHFQGSIT
jgi:hypothetical protein